MNTLLMTPSDVLFFRDGRPMSGSLSGHGAAWPLPTVTDAALHAALHRAVGGDRDEGSPTLGGEGVHLHVHGDPETGNRVRTFGSLQSAGPFPVRREPKSGGPQWYFPRPLDASPISKKGAPLQPHLLPLVQAPGDSGPDWRVESSLPKPLLYPVADTRTPKKDSPANWWSREAWDAYLSGEDLPSGKHFETSDSFSDTESSFGIGLDRQTNSQDGKRFYSAHYLRLKPDWSLGLFAEAQDKIDQDPEQKRDLIPELFPSSQGKNSIIVGGQQRICSVICEPSSPLPLPMGRADAFPAGKSGIQVKWILLTPAIFPAVIQKSDEGIPPHPGGWLPTWVSAADGQVQLKSGDSGRKKGEGRRSWRRRIAGLNPIRARLCAALTGKPEVVTGYALAHPRASRSAGPKGTLLAVPAGSIYYFECEDEDSASELARALNWHGDGGGQTIVNRRSSQFGEKGFGLGVCAPWEPHPGILPDGSH